MNLPIPVFASRFEFEANRQKIRKILKQIDVYNLKADFLINYKERPPLTKSDFKNLSQKWIFASSNENVITDSLFLMFVDSTPSEMAEIAKGSDDNFNLYYARIFNHEFGGTQQYNTTAKSLLQWANVYLITSIDSQPFLNWSDSEPWEVKE